MNYVYILSLLVILVHMISNGMFFILKGFSRREEGGRLMKIAEIVSRRTFVPAVICMIVFVTHYFIGV